MGKKFGNNRGLKRHKVPDKSGLSKHVTKSRRIQEKQPRNPLPSSSDESSEEQASSVASEEEVIHRKASMYDNLLRSLRPCSKSVDDACNRR